MLLGDLLAIVERRHGCARRARYVRQEIEWVGDREILDVDGAGQPAVGVDDKDLPQVSRFALPQLLERCACGQLAAKRRHARVHHAACRARRVIHQAAHFGRDSPRQQGETSSPRLCGNPHQRDGADRRIQRLQHLFQQFVGQIGNDFVDACGR
ncbi:MAG TPA: hypothetical protein VJA26_17330 [Gammaproteobacteria bacterium]|nr:hypothetical protein [Gammaproteobacteria bacterium]